MAVHDEGVYHNDLGWKRESFVVDVDDLGSKILELGVLDFISYQFRV